LNHDYTEADEKDEKNTLKSSCSSYSVKSWFKNVKEQYCPLLLDVPYPMIETISKWRKK
jgi:hypothetical protein